MSFAHPAENTKKRAFVRLPLRGNAGQCATGGLRQATGATRQQPAETAIK